jgi:hypothetical protein
MKTIYKYPLRIDDVQGVAIPFGARILTVQEQKGVVTLWALVENTNTPEMWEVRIVGTGNSAPGEGFDYVGSVQTSGGRFVWHVFARAPR